MTVEANKQLVRRYAEAIWNDGDLDLLAEFVPADYVLPGGMPDGMDGIQALRSEITRVRRAFPDGRVEIEEIVAEGDRVVWRWRMDGTHEGPYLGVAPTGRRVTMTGIALYRIAGGKIVERFGEADTIGLLDQLGALRRPSGAPAAPASAEA